MRHRRRRRRRPSPAAHGARGAAFPPSRSIELQDQLLTISGTRVPVEIGEAQRLERFYGAFERTLTLPKGIDPNAIAAEYADGVLTLHVPKPAEVKPKKIAIGGGTSQRAIEQ